MAYTSPRPRQVIGRIPSLPSHGGTTSLPNRGYAPGTVQAQALGAARGPLHPAVAAAGGQSVQQRLGAMSPTQKAAFTAWVSARTPAAGGAPAGGPPALMLPGVAEAGFLGQRNRANEGYADQLRQNTFNYNNTQNSYLSRFRDMATAQGEQLRTQPDQFVARGMTTSGAFNRNLSQMLTQQGRAHSDLVGQRAQQLAAITNQRNAIERSRADALGQIEAARQAAAARMAVGSVR